MYHGRGQTLTITVEPGYRWGGGGRVPPQQETNVKREGLWGQSKGSCGVLDSIIVCASIYTYVCMYNYRMIHIVTYKVGLIIVIIITM